MRIASAFLLLLFFSACGADDPVRLQLTPDQRDAFRAIAAARIDSLRPVMDSLCTVTQEARIAAVTDSIVQRRLEEETRLRTRLGQSMPQ